MSEARGRELGLSFPTIGISFRVQCPLTPPPLTAIICSVWTFNSPWGLFGFYHGTTIFVLKGISLLVQSSGFSRALPSSFYTCIPHNESSQCIISPTFLIFVQVLSYLSTFRFFPHSGLTNKNGLLTSIHLLAGKRHFPFPLSLRPPSFLLFLTISLWK